MLTIESYLNLTRALVAGDAPDLSQRQMSVFLTICLRPGPHTVRGMAQQMNVSKPAITRALDRLGELGLTKRVVDVNDKRSILAQTTPDGVAYLAAIKSHLPPDAEPVPVQQAA